MKKVFLFLMLSVVFVVSTSAVTVWNQCGGVGWTGETACEAGNDCVYVNEYFYQCQPAYTGGGELRLKVVSCKCKSGSSGKTAQWRTDGAGELCTGTMTGLTGCYSTSVFSMGTLLCEGSDVL